MIIQQELDFKTRTDILKKWPEKTAPNIPEKNQSEDIFITGTQPKIKKEKKTDARFSDKVLEPPKLSFGETINSKEITTIGGVKVDEVEKNLYALDPNLEKVLKEIKNRIPAGDYDKYILYIQEISKRLNNKTLLVRQALNDPSKNPITKFIEEDLLIFHNNCETLTNGKKIKKNDLLDLCLKSLETRLNSDEARQSPKQLPFTLYDVNSPVAELILASSSNRNQFKLLESEEGFSIAKDVCLELSKNNLSIEGDLLRLSEKIYQMTLKDGASQEDRKKIIKSVVDKYLELEKLNLSTGTKWVETLLIQKPGNLNEFKTLFTNMNLYIDGLITNGETNITRGFEGFNFYGIKIDGEIVKNLVKLHRYSGFLLSSRLNFYNDDSKENPQKKFEKLLTHMVRSFEDPEYMKDSKVAVAVLPAADDNLLLDAVSIRFGKSLHALMDNGYRILAFETYTDKQVAKAVKVASELTSRKIDLLLLAGHGSASEIEIDGKIEAAVNGKRINLGNTMWPENFQPMNFSVASQIKDRYFKKQSQIKFDSKIPKWEIVSLRNSKLTHDDVALDPSDAEIFTEIGSHVDPNGSVIYYSCGSGNEADRVKEVFAQAFPRPADILSGKFKKDFSLEDLPSSLCRVTAENTKIKTFAALLSIDDADLVFDDKKKVTGMKYYSHNGLDFAEKNREIIPTVSFPNDD